MVTVSSEQLSAHELPAARAAVAQSARARYEYVPRSGSVVAVWRDALSTFSARSAAILFCALVGFAAPTILGRWLHTQAKLSEYAQTRSVVALYEKASLTTLLVEAGSGVLALTLARSVITWIMLHGAQPRTQDESCRSFSEAIRVTLVRFPTLLTSSLLYSVMILVGIMGLSELTRGLEFDGRMMRHIWAGPMRALTDVSRQLVWHGVNALIPDPGPPFAEFVPDLRNSAFKQFTQATFV